ncbi:MAG TPA: DUF1015 domain-containing protein [Candidatus Binatia bacterium]|nr:DUF1015 domain-containing protein [Candidatus Binatia bacterium]
MADIIPFRALRYNLSKVSPGEVLTQPYDKITPLMQDRYYELSPYNLVRIIFGKSAPGDNEQQNVYRRAASSLKQWQAEGVLERDSEPSLYVYAQTFKVPGDPTGTEAERRGFIALGRVDDYDNKVVFRHEQTLSKPKADRLNLLRATDAHCELLFMVYDDPADEVGKLLAQDGPPTVELRDEYGVLHRMWKVSDPATVAAAQAKMAGKKLIIADGHHRYETALNFRNEMRAQSKANDPEAPYERVMIAFVNMDAPGLVILPTHRVVFGLESFNIFAKAAQVLQYFEIQDLGAVSDVQDAMRRLRDAGKDRTALLAVTAQNAFLLRAREGVQSPSLHGLSERQRALDVVQLHKLLLEEIIGMSEEDIRAQKYLKYIRDAQEAVNEVRSGAAQVAFLMNPVRMQQVRDIAFAGEVLPQKSTDFYPKMLSGLTIYPLSEAAQGTAGARQTL